MISNPTNTVITEKIKNSGVTPPSKISRRVTPPPVNKDVSCSKATTYYSPPQLSSVVSKSCTKSKTGSDKPKLKSVIYRANSKDSSTKKHNSRDAKVKKKKQSPLGPHDEFINLVRQSDQLIFEAVPRTSRNINDSPNSKDQLQIHPQGESPPYQPPPVECNVIVQEYNDLSGQTAPVNNAQDSACSLLAADSPLEEERWSRIASQRDNNNAHVRQPAIFFGDNDQIITEVSIHKSHIK